MSLGMDYDVEELRRIAGVDDLEEMGNENYRCMECDSLEYIDDYQKHTPNWCESCDDMRRFERLK